MAIKFDKDKMVELCSLVHQKLNKDVLDATYEAWGVFSSIEDDNPQKLEMKESITRFQNAYNSVAELFDAFLKNADAVQELQGRLEKYEVNQVQILEADATIEEIDSQINFEA